MQNGFNITLCRIRIIFEMKTCLFIQVNNNNNKHNNKGIIIQERTVLCTIVHLLLPTPAYVYLGSTQDQCPEEIKFCSMKYCRQIFDILINIRHRLIPLVSPAQFDYSLVNNPFSSD